MYSPKAYEDINMKVERIVIALFAGALIAVASSAWYARENFDSAESGYYLGRHMHTVIEKVYEIEFQASQVENASDIYEMSGEPYFAALTRQNAALLDKSIRSLSDSVKDNTDEMLKIAELATQISNLEKILPGIASEQSDNPKQGLSETGPPKKLNRPLKAAREITAGGDTAFLSPSASGEYLMGNIVSKGTQIISAEMQLLVERRKVSAEIRRNLVYATYYTAGAALIFIFIILLWLNRDIRRRRRAETKIRDNEEKLREMLEGVGDVIFSSDYSGRFTFINARLGSLTGYSTEELLGKHFTFLVHPDWAERVKEYYYLQFKNKMYETRYEFQILTKQGEIKWVEQNVVMVSKDKLVDSFQCVVRDITQRKNAEEEIRRTNQFLDSVLENIPDMIFIKDALDLRFLRFNKAGEELLGYLQEDLMGKNDYDFFPKQQADFFTQKDREVLNSHKRLDIVEEPITTKRGTHWLHTKKIPVYNSDGKPRYLLGISEDITERKKTEDTIIELNKSLARYVAELEESQRFYKTIARNFPDGTITVLDPALNYLFVDGLELAMEGLNAQELLGTSYLKRFPGEISEEVKNNLLPVFSGKSTAFEVALSGNYYVMHAAPLENAEGIIDEILIVKQNITRLKQAEEDIKAALDKEKLINEMKSRFVSLASHEFRTPLSTILSSTELIAEYIEHEEENPAVIREKNLHHLKRIKTSVQNMVNILNGFLSLEQLEQGKTITTPSEFDMQEFSTEITEEIQGKLKRGQKLESLCEPDDATLFADRSILKNMVLNLLANAIKYSPESSLIKYTAITDTEGVEIIIEDRGIGIPEVEQSNMFERFYRAKNALNIEGTGLGLSIVKKYIDLLNGNISFISNENEGTIFKILVPNAPPANENSTIKIESR